jgi:myo-inositol 2-dehydrogenase/D-chiro-inositol 1-dehydrogenase
MIGYGFMGRAHSNAFHQVGHFFNLRRQPVRKLICGRDREALERIATRWGWEETAADWRTAIDRKDIDAIDIAAPNGLHYDIAMAAVEAGKIVLCEKPLAITVEQARRMAEAARGRPTLVWFNYRRVPAVALAKDLISEDRIGTPYHYRASYLQQSGPLRRTGWKTERGQAGAGVVGDLLSHVTDMAMWLNGPIREVSATTRIFVDGREVEDAALAMVRFANGSMGSLEATRFGIGAINRNRFEIHGSNGMLAFDMENMNHLAYVDAREPKRLQGPKNLMASGPDHPYWSAFWRPGHIIGYEHTFIAALADFLLAVEAGEAFHPNFDDGLAVQQVLDAVERSAQTGAWTAV